MDKKLSKKSSIFKKLFTKSQTNFNKNNSDDLMNKMMQS